MANNIWSNYTEKTATPVDADEMMARDSTDGKNKRLLFGTFWKWVAKKLNEATISELETKNKTVIGALNYLNGKPFKTNILSSNAMIGSIEGSFQKTSSYSLFSGSTMSGLECGYYGYKHTEDVNASAIVFCRGNVFICIRDSKSKMWTEYTIK